MNKFISTNETYIQRLKGKNLTDYSLEELEYIKENLHINNFVYYVRKYLLETGSRHQAYGTPASSRIPGSFIGSTEKIIEIFNTREGKKPSDLIRELSHFTHEFLSGFKNVGETEISEVMNFLATLAPIHMIMEEEADLHIWNFKPIRDIDPSYARIFYDLYHNDIDPRRISNYQWYRTDSLEDAEWRERDQNELMKFIQRCMQSVIAHMENGYEETSISKALKNLYDDYHRIEQEQDFANFDHLPVNYVIQRPRNTLLLYGGQFFQRIGELETAYDWYTKDIMSEAFLGKLNYYMTDYKTAERLMMAYTIRPGVEVKNQMDEILRRALFNAALNSREILYLLENQTASIKGEDIFYRKGKMRNYMGQATREIFIMALMYRVLIENNQLTDTGYRHFFSG